MYHTRHQF